MHRVWVIVGAARDVGWTAAEAAVVAATPTSG